MIPEGITDKELVDIRTAQEAFMPSLIKVRRKVSVGDGEWEYTDWSSEIQSRLTPGFGFWREVSDRFQGATFFTIAVPWDTDIRASDEVVDAYGRTFEIRAVRDSATFQTAKSVLAERVYDA